jgi:uncharacterized protein (DUF2267 family)
VSVTGLNVFDRTVHKTNTWLGDVMDALGSDDRHAAYLALRATLHMLRDRLTVEEAAHLGAQLPMLMRGFYYEGWNPTGKPVRERSYESFLAGVAIELPNDLDPEDAVRAVFAVLASRVSEGEIDDVTHVLPIALNPLWPRQAA